MINRRRFLQSVAAAATAPALVNACDLRAPPGSELLQDNRKLLQLPRGFSYSVVSRAGEAMSDGMAVPGAHDGMAAFNGEDGRVILVRNHELTPTSTWAGSFRQSVHALTDHDRRLFYDNGGGVTPGLGGTTTTIYNPQSRETERQFLSLAGTEINCAGGKTPWGSWLSCEESFGQPGTASTKMGVKTVREKRHGYVFEVPASATSPVKAVPLTSMGRFEHEAVAVHEPSGVLYLTEDRWHSLFYRFLPNVRGSLQRGGKLQALAIVNKPSQKTHNWETHDIPINAEMETAWIDLEDVDSADNDLRKRGALDGAAMFARGEGLTAAGDQIVFTCTIGGPERLGQVFAYQPSPFEGSRREQESPGRLSLIAESTRGSLLKSCDNLTMAPWGDLIVCEDTVDGTDACSLVGIRPDGSQYLLANNAYSDSELAGVCFSPDGKTLFVNIQYPGMTLAITGPWPS